MPMTTQSKSSSRKVFRDSYPADRDHRPTHRSGGTSAHEDLWGQVLQPASFFFRLEFA